jgi:HK97 family phage major capsid protein
MSKITELRQARAKTHADLSAVLALAPTAENNERARKMIADIDTMKVEIDKLESRTAPVATVEVDKDLEVRRAFGSYLREGERIDSETRAILKQAQRDGVVEGAPMTGHVGSYSGLGYFVPTGFVNAVEVTTKYYADLMNVCGSMETATGAPLPFPTNDDTSNAAVWLGESASVSELDITASQVVLGAYKASTGMIKASLEIVEDSAFDLASFVANAMGNRLGRLYEQAFTTGTGSSQPTGLLTAIASSGMNPVIAAGSSESSGGGETGANSIGWSDLVNLEHSVDPSYRRGAKYMFSDATLGSLKKILDKFGRPLWVPGVTSSEPDRINGYEYVINQAMPSAAATHTSVIFGDFSKFVIRKVKGLSVLVLRERFADNGQVAYIGFARIDSNLIANKALNVIQQHS